MAKLARAGTAPASAWRRDVETAVQHRPASWDEIPADDGALHPVTLSHGVRDALARHPGATLIIDGGEVGQWFQACLEAEVRIINGPSGAIGGCLPYAIGAKAARPDHPVFVLLGDGTAGFHFAEFETAVRTALPFVAIIGNDSYWNAEHQIQLNSFGSNRTFACDLTPARYDQAAAGLGAHGEHVTTATELAPALERALASDLPSCLNVTLDGQPAPVVTRN
jgi:acetolactate synthase-1/2/3 large subunit